MHRSAPAPLLAAHAQHAAEHEGSRALVDEGGRAADVRLRTVAWGLFSADAIDHGRRPAAGWDGATASADDVGVATAGPDGVREIRSRYLVVASGAYDRPVPFEGWTLAGVMTAGALHTLVKMQGLVPCERIALVDTHPFLLRWPPS